MDKNSKIYIAGHNGLVGSSLVNRLYELGYKNLILRNRGQLNLKDRSKVFNFFMKHQPDYVFLAAAKVGGILANDTHPVDFIMDNLSIEMNVIECSYISSVKKLLFLGSSCIYPRDCKQPIKEEYLLTGPLEKTNEQYAIAKIAGIKMCQAYNKQYKKKFISVMPTNLYGQGDHFDLETSHVLPALIRKFHDAKVSGKEEVVIWGTGSPKREFLYVEDLSDACIYLMCNYNSSEVINIGTGEDISIKNVAKLVSDVVGFCGKIVYDSSKPNGTPRKLLNVSKLHALGWKHQTSLKNGLNKTYKWCLDNCLDGNGLFIE